MWNVKCGIKMLILFKYYVSSMNYLPNVSFDDDFEGQRIVKNNFIIKSRYGLVSSKYCLMQVTGQMFLFLVR